MSTPSPSVRWRRCAAFFPEPVGLFQLDAHADLRESYEGSRFSHACVGPPGPRRSRHGALSVRRQGTLQEEVTYREKHHIAHLDAAAVLPIRVQGMLLAAPGVSRQNLSDPRCRRSRPIGHPRHRDPGSRGSGLARYPCGHREGHSGKNGRRVRRGRTCSPCGRSRLILCRGTARLFRDGSDPAKQDLMIQQVS